MGCEEYHEVSALPPGLTIRIGGGANDEARNELREWLSRRFAVYGIEFGVSEIVDTIHLPDDWRETATDPVLGRPTDAVNERLDPGLQQYNLATAVDMVATLTKQINTAVDRNGVARKDRFDTLRNELLDKFAETVRQRHLGAKKEEVE